MNLWSIKEGWNKSNKRIITPRKQGTLLFRGCALSDKNALGCMFLHITKMDASKLIWFSTDSLFLIEAPEELNVIRCLSGRRKKKQ